MNCPQELPSSEIASFLPNFFQRLQYQLWWSSLNRLKTNNNPDDIKDLRWLQMHDSSSIQTLFPPQEVCVTNSFSTTRHALLSRRRHPSIIALCTDLLAISAARGTQDDLSRDNTKSATVPGHHSFNSNEVEMRNLSGIVC